MRTRAQQIFGEGLIAGLVAYAVVAVVLTAENLLAGQPAFHTAAVLGGLLVSGGEPGAGVVAVFAYNGLHLLVLVLAGMAAASVITRREELPVLWKLAGFAFVTSFAYDLLLHLLLLEAGAGGGPGWVTLAGVDALAALGLVTYLRAVHPGLWNEIRHRDGPGRRTAPADLPLDGVRARQAPPPTVRSRRPVGAGRRVREEA